MDGIAAEAALAEGILPGVVVVDFGSFYAREYSGLLRLGIGLVDRPERAEELVQDAFERALLRWDRLENPGAFLRTALVNAARSELRRRAVVRRSNIPQPLPTELPDLHLDLLRALRTLTARRRIALVLRFFADMSEAEIAVAMGCRVGTVKSLVSRGLADLREVIDR
jgi:RNA polymerase sigma-70 factor (sigma-E family)